MKINVTKEDWTAWLIAKGLSDRTIQNYSYYFDRFSLKDLNQQGVISFMNKHKVNDVCKAFLKSLISYVLIKDYSLEVKGKIHQIQIPKKTGRRKKRLIKTLTKQEIHELAKGMPYMKGSLMVLLSFYGGLRNQEVRSIRPYDFNWSSWFKKRKEKGYLTIIGKGDKEDRVIVPPFLMELVYSWIKSHVSAKADSDPNEPMFKMGERQWEKKVKEYSERVLNNPITPHNLRHSCGTYLHEKGCGIMFIKDYMRHESIQTTQKYINMSKKGVNNRIYEALSS